jgi:hypothetical protein
MKTLTSTGRAWLKGLHIVCTCAWVGAGICMFLLTFVVRPNNSHDLYVVMAALTLIDDWLIIPAAVGSLLTGLLISWMTPWGFFKWRWVAAKWVLTIIMTLFGVFYLSPWLHEMAAITVADPIGAFQNETFLTNHWLLTLSGGPMFLAMLSLIFLSVIKPWGKRTRGRLDGHPSVQRAAPAQRPAVDNDHRRGLGQAGAQPIQIDMVEAVPAWQPGTAQPQLGGDPQRLALSTAGARIRWGQIAARKSSARRIGRPRASQRRW